MMATAVATTGRRGGNRNPRFATAAPGSYTGHIGMAISIVNPLPDGAPIVDAAPDNEQRDITPRELAAELGVHSLHLTRRFGDIGHMVGKTRLLSPADADIIRAAYRAQRARLARHLHDVHIPRGNEADERYLPYVDPVLRVVSEHYLVTREGILAKQRDPHLVHARCMAMVLLYRFGAPATTLSRFFGRDRSTVLYSLQKYLGIDYGTISPTRAASLPLQATLHAAQAACQRELPVLLGLLHAHGLRIEPSRIPAQGTPEGMLIAATDGHPQAHAVRTYMASLLHDGSKAYPVQTLYTGLRVLAEDTTIRAAVLGVLLACDHEYLLRVARHRAERLGFRWTEVA